MVTREISCEGEESCEDDGTRKRATTFLHWLDHLESDQEEVEALKG